MIQTSKMSSLVEGDIKLEIHANKLSAEILDGLSKWGKVERINRDRIVMTLGDETVLPAINRHLVALGLDVYTFSPRKTSLEDLFLRVVGDDKAR